MKELAVVIQVENDGASIEWQGGEKYREVDDLKELISLLESLCKELFN